MEDNNKQYEDVCSMCRRPESVTGPQIRMPGNITVCRDCIQKSFDTFGKGFPFGDFNLNGFTVEPANKDNTSENQPNGNVKISFSGKIPTQFTTPPVKEDYSDSLNPDLVSDEELMAGKLNNNGNKDADNDSDGSNDGSNDTNNASRGSLDGFLNSIFGKNGLPQFFLNIGGPDMLQGQRVVKKKKPEKEPVPELKIDELPPPHVIKSCLDDYVVGQEHAKKVIAVAVYNHYKRVTDPADDDIEIEKSNMLMLGPTGCGKTYLVKTLARILNVPLAITDATTLTEAGYIGDDVESVLSKLLQAADNNVEKAEHGIVFIDEIDKIAKKRNTTSRDVSGESVQQGLLKLLEGSEVEVPVGATSKNAMVPMTTIDTSKILFICGGAFPDLEEIIKQRLTKHSSIGFDADLKDKFDDDPDLLQKVSTEDLREYGMIPEFLGRLPVVYALRGLDVEAYKKILTEPKNAILKQYKKLLAMDEVELVFDDSALEAIAQKAIERKTGARALRAIIEEFMLDIMYEIPKDDNIGRVTITGDYINKKGAPIIDMRGQTKKSALIEEKTTNKSEE